MNKITSRQGVESSLGITVIRADGTREEYGTVCAFYKNPLKRFLWNLFFTLRMKHRLRRYRRQHG